jgi:hypothetical protein
MQSSAETSRGIEFLRNIVESGKALKMSDPRHLRQGSTYQIEITGFDKQCYPKLRETRSRRQIRSRKPDRRLADLAEEGPTSRPVCRQPTWYITMLPVQVSMGTRACYRQLTPGFGSTSIHPTRLFQKANRCGNSNLLKTMV